MECVPAEACSGGKESSCEPGYTGDICGECELQWYRIEQSCRPCPDLAFLLLVAFFVGLALIMALGVYLQNKAMNFAGLAIGVVRNVTWVACIVGFSFCYFVVVSLFSDIISTLLISV